MKGFITRQKNKVHTAYKDKADARIMHKAAIHDIALHETSANVVEKLPDRTVEAGTALTVELPEFIPEPPESMEFLWFFTIDKQGGKQTYTENEIASIEPATGEIRALTPGKVSVSLMKTIENGNYELDTFELTVVKHGGIIPVSQILLDKTKVTIMENEVTYLKTAVVPENAYYQKAVLWAVQEGITAGYTPTSFCPDMDCTRA